MIADNFPIHRCGLYLTHNAHKDVYETIQAYLDRHEGTWISPEEKEQAILANDVWELQWYPDTPIGFYHLLGASLDAILKAAKDIEANDKKHGGRSGG